MLLRLHRMQAVWLVKGFQEMLIRERGLETRMGRKARTGELLSMISSGHLELTPAGGLWEPV